MTAGDRVARSPTCARFATRLILIEALRLRPCRVWLPALYCPKVAGALARIGLRPRYYDLDGTLTPTVSNVDRSDLLVWMHPFGLVRQLPSDVGPRVLVDACHAMRSLLAGDGGRPALHPTVVSFRKEIPGGRGALLVPAGEAVDPPSLLAGDGGRHHRRGIVERGIAATRTARRILGAALPSGRDTDVLTHLPLNYWDRDSALAHLRDAGVGAWHWRRPLPNFDPEATPMAHALARTLLLVPLPDCPAQSERVARQAADLGPASFTLGGVRRQ